MYRDFGVNPVVVRTTTSSATSWVICLSPCMPVSLAPCVTATVGLKVQENSRCENVSSSVSSSRFYQTILPLLFFQQRKALILGSTRSTCCRL